MSKALTYQKPCPNESIYKHLHMLHNYLQEAGEREQIVFELKEALLGAAKQIAKVAEGKYVRKLQEFGE